MTENMRKFITEVSKDEERRQKAGKMSQEELTAFAGELGIQLTEADFEKADGSELTDNELEAVAGGFAFCLILGGGSEGGKDPLDCIITGWGHDMVCALMGFNV